MRLYKSNNLCNTANVYQIPLPFYATKIISFFLNSIISANQKKRLGIGANPYTPYCFSSVESLL